MLMAAADLQVIAACFVIFVHIHIYAELPFAQQIIRCTLDSFIAAKQGVNHTGKPWACSDTHAKSRPLLQKREH